MNKKLFILLPIVVWLLFCFSEWYMWIAPPYPYFYARGSTIPNLDYEAITVGDLVPILKYVTPVPRKCRYVTDKYGSRNSFTTKFADILVIGDSFAWGAGNDHEDTPVVQLGKLTNKTVLFAPMHHEIYNNETSVMGKIALLIKYKKPIKFKTIVWIMLDLDLCEPPFTKEPKSVVNAIFKNKPIINISGPFNFNNTFTGFKGYLKEYSPQAIIGRKLKTKLELSIASFRRKFNLIPPDSFTSGFLFKHKRMIYGDIPFSKEEVNNCSIENKRFIQTVEGLEALNKHAKERGVNLLLVIVPRKSIAYNKYKTNPIKISGYGPGELLYGHLAQRGINAVFTHPEIIKAVDEEMQRDKKKVYWSDDTHWDPYGINIAMRMVRARLLALGML